MFPHGAFFPLVAWIELPARLCAFALLVGRTDSMARSTVKKPTALAVRVAIPLPFIHTFTATALWTRPVKTTRLKTWNALPNTSASIARQSIELAAMLWVRQLVACAFSGPYRSRGLSVDIRLFAGICCWTAFSGKGSPAGQNNFTKYTVSEFGEVNGSAAMVRSRYLLSPTQLAGIYELALHSKILGLHFTGCGNRRSGTDCVLHCSDSRV